MAQELKQQPEFNMEKALAFNKKHHVKTDQEIMGNLTTYAKKTTQLDLLKTDKGLARLVYNFQKDYCAHEDGMAGTETKEALELWKQGMLTDATEKKIKVSFIAGPADKITGIEEPDYLRYPSGILTTVPKKIKVTEKKPAEKPAEKQITPGRTVTLNGTYKLETLSGIDIQFHTNNLVISPSPTYYGFVGELKKGIQDGTVTVKGMDKEKAIERITNEYNVALQNRTTKANIKKLY